MNIEVPFTEKRLKPETVRRLLGALNTTEGFGSFICSLPAENQCCAELPGGFNPPAQVLVQAQRSSTGFMVFGSRQNKEFAYTLVIPPFPVQKTLAASYIETAPLLEMLDRPYMIGIVLIRLGSFAFGVSRGQNLIASKVGTGLVHGRHRQGGSSANRFARHREKQMEAFFTRACNYLREYFEPHEKQIDYMLYGGARTTIQEFKKQCSFTAVLNQPELPLLLDIPDPRQAVLQQAVERAWSSRVFTWTVQKED